MSVNNKDFKEELNEFFVECFYSIMRAEEKSLEKIVDKTLSLKEIHVIEAVFKTLPNKENNFSNISRMLKVTMGTLTTSYNKLEKKGFLTKIRDTKDKRFYYILPTEKAGKINDIHTQFHQRLIEDISNNLSASEQMNLIASLKMLSNFFDKLENY